MKKLIAITLIAFALAACGEATEHAQPDAAKPIEQPKPEAQAMNYEMSIEGMMCGNCVASVKKTLEAQPGVASADVNLEKKLATIHVKPGASFDMAAATAAVNKDFEVKSCAPVATH